MRRSSRLLCERPHGFADAGGRQPRPKAKFLMSRKCGASPQGRQRRSPTKGPVTRLSTRVDWRSRRRSCPTRGCRRCSSAAYLVTEPPGPLALRRMGQRRSYCTSGSGSIYYRPMSSNPKTGRTPRTMERRCERIVLKTSSLCFVSLLITILPQVAYSQEFEPIRRMCDYCNLSVL